MAVRRVQHLVGAGWCKRHERRWGLPGVRGKGPLARLTRDDSVEATRATQPPVDLDPLGENGERLSREIADLRAEVDRIRAAWTKSKTGVALSGSSSDHRVR